MLDRPDTEISAGKAPADKAGATLVVQAAAESWAAEILLARDESRECMAVWKAIEAAAAGEVDENKLKLACWKALFN